MLEHLVIHFSLRYVTSGRLQEVKNKRKFQTFSSKSGRGRLRERGGRLQEVFNVVIWPKKFWYFGKLLLVAYEGWLQPEVRLYTF